MSTPPLGRRLGWACALLVLLAPLTVLVLARDDGDPPGMTAAEGTVSIPSVPSLGGRPLGSPRPGIGPARTRCRGVTVRRGADPHRVLAAHRPGTTYCFSAGTHRVRRPLRPQRGDSLVGRPGAVLNGSRVVSGWRRDDDGWTAPAFLPPEPSTHGECLPEAPTCTFAEDVFLDGRRLSRAASASSVSETEFHADYARGTITVGTDPAGRLVEQAVAPALVRSAASRVTVRNLVLEKAANVAQAAAVDGRTESPRTGARWRVVHNLVRLNHGVGVGVGSRGLVRANVIRDQGQLGVSLWEEDARVSGNLIAHNGTAGYDQDWEAGGLKAWVTLRVRIDDNRVVANRGPGLWSDGGCLRTVYRGNHVSDNWGAGIQHEISYDALVAGNHVLRNGRRHKGWAWEAGIQVQSSGGLRGGLVVVRGNVVSSNANGIMVLQSGHRRTEWPAPHGPHVVRNVLVRRNTVTMRPGQWTGLVHDVGDHRVFRRGIRFRANTYRLRSRTQRAFHWRDHVLRWRQWRGAGARQDRGGRLVVPR